MKAEIINLTPSKAKELLDKNIGNRKVKLSPKNSYVMQMKGGYWKENGEPIIVDCNGFIKDGQHRLLAVIESGFEYNVPLITGVDPNVMDTIDTGSNRSLGDVLELNGFSMSNITAGIIKTILAYKQGISTHVSGGRSRAIPNSVGLEFALKNQERLIKLVKAANRISKSQKISVLSSSEVALFLYAISEFEYNDESYTFVKSICTNSLGEASCTNYGYRKLLDAKLNKVSLSAIYKYNLISRLWDIFQNDVPVRKLRISIDKFNYIK